MKVICIDNHLDRDELDLTQGKIYDVIQTSVEMYLIKDDSGDRCWYYNDVLMPLEKWREIRLKELNI